MELLAVRKGRQNEVMRKSEPRHIRTVMVIVRNMLHFFFTQLMKTRYGGSLIWPIITLSLTPLV